MFKLIKLKILRMLFILLLSVAEIVTLKVKTGLYYPIKWLNHYLKGSGSALKVPMEVVHGAKTAFNEAIDIDSYNHKYESWSGKYCICHSTLYEGSGFYNRPTLFYLLGGFTFKVYTSYTGRVLVSGKDHYDWHPTYDCEGEPQYFTSPLGNSVLMNLIIKLMGFIFGRDYFVTAGFPSGEAGISNKLWADFEKVGAKPFNSFFYNVPMWDTVEELKEVGYIDEDVPYKEEMRETHYYRVVLKKGGHKAHPGYFVHYGHGMSKREIGAIVKETVGPNASIFVKEVNVQAIKSLCYLGEI